MHIQKRERFIAMYDGSDEARVRNYQKVDILVPRYLMKNGFEMTLSGCGFDFKHESGRIMMAVDNSRFTELYEFDAEGDPKIMELHMGRLRRIYKLFGFEIF